MFRTWPWFGLAALVVVADQVTKSMVLARFAEREVLPLTSYFNLVLVYNKGAAFSFLSDAPGWQTPVLSLFAIAAIGVVAYFIVNSPGRTLLCTALGLVLGGAIGNLIDRLRFGKVVDFLDFYLDRGRFGAVVDFLESRFGTSHWPAFNLADSAICVGIALILLDGFRKHERRAGASA